MAGKLPVGKLSAAKNWLTKALRIGESKPLMRSVDAPEVSSSKALLPTGKHLGSINDVFKNPQLLKNKTPAEVESVLKGTPGYQIERLGRGRHAGQGWVFREYNAKGNPTGPQLRWHPGGGHHGPKPYWRVVDDRGKKTGPIYDETGWRPHGQ